MKRVFSVLNNEKGSPLVIVVLILALLTLIGLSVLNTTSLETQIAGHHRRHKMTFYGADGGIEIACELLEQNIACANGFTDNTGGNGTVIGLDPVPAVFPCPDAANNMPGVRVNDLRFKGNPLPAEPTTIASSDLFYPANMTDACPNWPHTRVTVGQVSKGYATGAGISHEAGYEGKGKSAYEGGTIKFYNLFSQRVENGDDVTIRVGYRHVSGGGGGCIY